MKGRVFMTLETFKSKFVFKPELAFHVGVEREFFIADKHGKIVPRSKEVLALLENPLGEFGSYSYELSACQIESQSKPCADVGEMWRVQIALDTQLEKVMQSLGLQLLCLEVAPDDMPLDVFDDPLGRYKKITSCMPWSVLLAACRVTGTHFHVGMPDLQTALRVYNSVIKHCDELSSIGDKSNGRRLEVYKEVAPKCMPRAYDSLDEFYSFAKSNGFSENPRDCWDLIRLTIHGTIEFRNFGVTESIDDVIKWAERCRSLCLQY